MTAGFVHLHLHSEYSLADSIIRIPGRPEQGDPARAAKPNLISRAVELQMPAIAVTDLVNLFALVKFYRAAQANGIKPIIGCDLWLDEEQVRADNGTATRVTVLCQDDTGYLNLSRLVSRAYAGVARGALARVKSEWLAEASDGLIVLAGRESACGQALLAGRPDLAQRHGEWWREHFDDRLYLEICRLGREHDETLLAGTLELAAQLDLPAVASNDVRFLSTEDFEAHEARVCIHSSRVLADPKRPRDYTPEQYLKSAQEMHALFADLPQALENSVEIAKRCNFELQLGTYHLPSFPVPQEHDTASYFHSQAHAGLEARLQAQPLAPGHDRESYTTRLDVEIGVINEMGFPGYFLIVADFIRFARDNGIPVGPGRGSGAGSLVAWVLGITDLDPLRYGLLFERFLNPERVSMPDFDIDFCMDRRDEVIDYVAQKYGRERVSQIITYGTMAARAVLRDAGRVLSMPYGQVDRYAKLVPARPLDLSLGDALGLTEKATREPDRVAAEFKQLYAEDPDARELIDLALKLEDLTRNAGRHAGGVVIAPGPLSDYAPLYCEPGSDAVVTQFDKDDVESVGLVKFDFLGLRTLTIIDWAVAAINAQRRDNGEDEIDIRQLPTDDPAVFALLRRAQTVAVFQLESRGMQSLLKDAQPDRFEDIIALVSLYRPGPMDLIPSFCARKNGRETVTYPDPRVEPILRETYGIMVYQEQVMQMAQIIGGYSLGAADLLRRAMGKKNVAEMAHHRQIFREGAAGNGLDADRADTIFDQMEKFAGYGFNKSHAAAYALVAYQTAWLKAHYPAQFMAAVLSADMDHTDKIVTFLAEARAMQLVVHPPDVNSSAWQFVADQGEIRYGLGAIKGVGRGAVEAILTAREDRPLRSLADLCMRVAPGKLNKRVLEALIQCGALDGVGPNRATLMHSLPDAMRAAEQHARDAATGQHDIFGVFDTEASTPAIGNAEVLPEWPIERKLAGERDTLGHYLSGHPTDAWQELISRIATCPIGDIAQHHRPPSGNGADGDNGQRTRMRDQPFVLAGQITAIRKRGESMAFVTIEDASGQIETKLFRDAWDEFGSLITRDAILVFEGGLSIDYFSGGYQLRVRKVQGIESACEQYARLLWIALDQPPPALAQSLREILAAHPGSTPVRIAWRDEVASAQLELPPPWQVCASNELIAALQATADVTAAQLLFDNVLPAHPGDSSGG